MPKYLTIEMKFADDVDVYSESVQDGMVQATMTTEGVLEARVVGVGEGPDPEPAPPANADQIEADNADGEGQMEPSGDSPQS